MNSIASFAFAQDKLAVKNGKLQSSNYAPFAFCGKFSTPQPAAPHRCRHRARRRSAPLCFSFPPALGIDDGHFDADRFLNEAFFISCKSCTISASLTNR
jgi:hypothetical protein